TAICLRYFFRARVALGVAIPTPRFFKPSSCRPDETGHAYCSLRGHDNPHHRSPGGRDALEQGCRNSERAAWARLTRTVETATPQRSTDWAGSVRSYGLLWGVPVSAIVVGLLIDVPARTFIWIIALGWMGTACILNGRRCGRTHCRFTGPYYLAMIIPVLALGSGIVSFGLSAWLALAVLIILGSKLIWWGTERAWGKFS